MQLRNWRSTSDLCEQSYSSEIWSEFLRIDENKNQLLKSLEECLSTLKTDKQVITSIGEHVVCNVQCGVSRLAPCSHEKADTRTRARRNHPGLHKKPHSHSRYRSSDHCNTVYKTVRIECSMRTQSGITQDEKHKLLHRNFIYYRTVSYGKC